MQPVSKGSHYYLAVSLNVLLLRRNSSIHDSSTDLVSVIRLGTSVSHSRHGHSSLVESGYTIPKFIQRGYRRTER